MRNSNNIYFDKSGIHKQVDNSTFALVYVETENVEVLENKILRLEK